MKSVVALLCLATVALANEKAFFFFTAPRVVEEVSVEQVTSDVMAKLKDAQGSDTGVYHVYLPDGRLQKVEYTTAPLEAQPKKETEQPKKPFFPVFKTVALPTPADDMKDNKESENYKSESPATGYVASVTYTDVEPLQGPVYVYNPKPAVRTVRYAPQYQ
ncbi:uncharacterized protein LOC106661325 [Cimex lectularius]|uniref:CPR type cuticle protein n=1 Tax=Cimex lectularius TaxID=79782 RepID=A0A8I6TBA1_CIMLE|nr:uncharacterized protein LOC106661325 [Cimex lectularius]